MVLIIVGENGRWRCWSPSLWECSVDKPKRNGPDPEIQPAEAYDIPGDWQGYFAPSLVQFQDSSPEEGPTSQPHATPVKLTFEPNRFPLNH